MCLLHLILAVTTLCISEAQVMFPDEMNTNNNNNKNNKNVDNLLLQGLLKIANAPVDGDAPLAPVGPDIDDNAFLNTLINGPGAGAQGGAQPPAPINNPNCQDSRPECVMWAANGECKRNIDYMAPHCKRSCKYCEKAVPDCENSSDYCWAWQIRGECLRNPDYMRYNCRVACDQCGDTWLDHDLRRFEADPPGYEAHPPGPPNDAVVNVHPPGPPNDAVVNAHPPGPPNDAVVNANPPGPPNGAVVFPA